MAWHGYRGLRKTYPHVQSAYTSEPFTCLSHWRKLALGELMKSRSEGKNQRRGSRTKAVFPVRVKGKDSTGAAFEDLAHTLDVTASGVRLGAIRHELNEQDEVTLFYRQRKMQYRVVWTKKLKGTSEFQVGLTAVSQDREAWGLNPADFKAESGSVAASRASGVA